MTLTRESKLGYISEIDKHLIDRYNGNVDRGLCDSLTTINSSIKGKGSTQQLIFSLTVEISKTDYALASSCEKHYTVYSVNNQLVYVEV